MKKIVYIILVQLLITYSVQAISDFQLKNLRVEYKSNPFIEEDWPRLSWEIEASGFNNKQMAYQILASSSPELLEKNIGDLWDSKKINSRESNQIEYAGKGLASRQIVYWKVKVWDQDKKMSNWSEGARFEMGLKKKSDWTAAWIGSDFNALAQNPNYHLPPASYLRKETEIRKRVKSARLYISSLGVQEFYINGHRIGKDYFSSGWTDYNKRVYYQIYDVTEHIQTGHNTFTSILGSGWYSGYLGYALLVGSPKTYGFYGDFPLLKAQVELVFSDGSKQLIQTDTSWKVNTGGIVENDFLQGEKFDARVEPYGWMNAGYKVDSWKNAIHIETDRNLELYPSQPIQVVNQLAPKTVKKIGEKKFIVDFGQNFAGIIQLNNIIGLAGDSLVLRYGEMLNPDGSLMTENLRRARATDTYIFKGDKAGESWAPKFTYHGFQFVEISGLDLPKHADFVKGLVLSSNLSQVGTFETNHSMLNQLYSNINWTQKANYLDIPTDCPQRDERLGWTGDAQVYMRSALYNTDIATFHKKWIRDLNDAQWTNGAYPIYAPMPVDQNGIPAIRKTDTYSPGWSDAGIICTYEIFKAYQDLRVVKESMPYMEKYMDFLFKKSKGKYLLSEGAFEEIDPKGGFGDWLSIGEKTSPDLLASLYYYYCASLMQEMAAGISDQARSSFYVEVKKQVKSAVSAHFSSNSLKFQIDPARYGNRAGYVTEGSSAFSGHTQTAYANAIYMNLFEEEDLKKVGQYLEDLVQQNNGQLSTGFLGFKPLLPALSRSGHTDLAYDLILSEEYPSLGFEVKNGATTIWERWDSYIKDEGFRHNAAMNSFSHYAFGSVNEWFFEHMAGIKNASIGYRSIIIRPEIAKHTVDFVKAKYHSINGVIVANWSKNKQILTQEIIIPVNVEGLIYVPTKDASSIIINGQSINDQKAIKLLRQEGDYFVLQSGSGNYKIESKI